MESSCFLTSYPPTGYTRQHWMLACTGRAVDLEKLIGLKFDALLCSG